MVEKHRLSNLNEALKRRRAEGSSLRDLADYMNVRILGSVLADSKATVAGDPASLYAVLNGDESSVDRRVTVEDQLAGVGIDHDEVREDFVSYQSIRRHMQNCLGMDTGRRGIESIEEGREVIHRTLDRDRRIIERTIGRLQRISSLEAKDVDVSVTINVTCESCGKSYRVDEFLDETGCSCSGEEAKIDG